MTHNAIKYATADLNAFQIASGLAREASGVERLSESLTPTLDLYNQNARRYEFDIHRLVYDFSFSQTQAAVAAEFGMIGVGLPVFAGTTQLQLLVVEGVSVQNTVAAKTFRLAHSTRAIIAATLTVGGQAANRDQRWASGTFVYKQQPQIETWTGSDTVDLAAIGSNGFESLTIGIDTTLPFLGGPWIVKPGGVLFVQCSTVNLAFGASIWGYVRPALPGEFPNPLT